MISVLAFWVWSFFAFVQIGQTYYISPDGNDANDGKKTAKAWKSLQKVNQLALKAGDKVLFEGGKTFYGTLRLDENDGGNSSNQLRIGTYGRGKATI